MTDELIAKFPFFETFVIGMVMFLALLLGIHCTMEAKKVDRLEAQCVQYEQFNSLKFQRMTLNHAEDVQAIRGEIHASETKAALDKVQQELNSIPNSLKLGK